MIHPYVLNSLFSRCHFDCCVLLSVSSKCTFICIHKYTSGAANMSCVLFVSNIVLCICICICICISAMAFAFACACKCSWYNWWVLNPLWRLKVPSEGLLFEEDGWAGRQPQLLLPGGSRKCISAFASVFVQCSKCISAICAFVWGGWMRVGATIFVASRSRKLIWTIFKPRVAILKYTFLRNIEKHLCDSLLFCNLQR